MRRIADSTQETAALVRSKDWSQTALGDPSTWDGSLRTILGLMLGSKFPMFVAWGPELTFIYNDAYAPFLADRHPGAMGGRFPEIWSDIWTDIEPLVRDAMAGKATWFENLPFVMRRHGQDENTFFTFSYSPAHADDGSIAGMFCACNETTGQVVAEKELRDREAALAASLAAQEDLLTQKDVLLAEVNHRVKNSLQLVVSALSLQRRQLADSSARTAFDQAITRVRAITSVHERLYKSGNPLIVQMRTYLEGLLADLVDGSELQDRVEVVSDEVELRTEQAIPIALIVNELVTNVLKYAYPPGEPGPVRLELRTVENGMLVLSVSDEGTSMSSTTPTGGLGTRLIDTMTSQLAGRIDRRVTEPGYVVSIEFARDEA